MTTCTTLCKNLYKKAAIFWIIQPLNSRFVDFDQSIILFCVLNRFVLMQIKCVGYILRINYVKTMQFVWLSRPYFDDFLSVNMECQLKIIVLSKFQQHCNYII